MTAIVIASSRKGSPERPRDVWDDLIMAANSATLYAAEHELVVAWKGPCPPAELLSNPRLRLVEQPDGCRSFGEAFGWAVDRTDADELILMNDDAVLTPDTVPVLLEDVALVRANFPEVPLGFMVCRSNFAPGPQNVRVPNGGELRPNGMRYDTECRVLPAARVSPIVGYIAREALDAIGGFPPINWFSDDLMCWDLARRGYRSFVSRAYVHHIGQRATTQDGATEEDLGRAGREWVRQHRPDFWEALRRATG